MDFEFSNIYAKNIILISIATNKGSQLSTEVTKFRGHPKIIWINDDECQKINKIMYKDFGTNK